MSYFENLEVRNKYKKHTFHDGASNAGNGNRVTIEGESVLRAGIKQNTTNSVIECHGIDSTGNDEIIIGYDRLNDEKANTTATAISLAYSVAGYEEVYFKTVANNIMIKGKLL